MKKQLLTTTALVAAGVIAASSPAFAQKKGNVVQLEVKGYMEYVLGILFDQADGIVDDNVPAVDNHMESEIWFKGSGKLDNGITITADAQFENIGVGPRVDETYIRVSGFFGSLMLGQEDNAANLMVTGYSGSWATGVGQNLTFDRADWIGLPVGFVGGGSRFNATLNDIRLRSGGEDDSMKISYFTPRFEGVQVGVSYIPNFARQGPGRGGAVASTAGVYNQGFSIAANFDRKFDQVRVGIAGGYLQAESPGTVVGVNTKDMSAYVLAARVDFGGIRLAGAYKKNDDVRDNTGTSATTSLDGGLFDVGARYTWGPNAVSVGYSQGETEGTIATAGDDEEKGFMVGLRRILGPGVHLKGTIHYSDYTDEVNAGATSSNDGVAATTSILLIF